MKDIPLLVNSSVMDAVRKIESSKKRMTVVVDNDNFLLGTLTDGDVRRYLLAGGQLDDLATKSMNMKPTTATIKSTVDQIEYLMRRNNVLAIPIVDESGKFIELFHINDVVRNSKPAKNLKSTFSFAVIMAGGEGNRLRPITEKIPKPMVKIGNKPILQYQLEILARVGINKVFISINYLGHVIEDYFGNGSDFGIEIIYIRENEKLGTAGSLALLPETPKSPFLILNGDVFTASNYDALFDFHIENDAEITVGAIDYRIEIPYGVIETNGVTVKEIVEKPSRSFFCNAGIYAASPSILHLIPKERMSNMTEIIDISLKNGMKVCAFPIFEYWTDIGTLDNLEKAKDIYAQSELLNEW
jgi:dTDP-glucose pyrophosphorylase